MLVLLNPNQNPVPVDVPTGGSASLRVAVVASAGPVIAAQYGQAVAADPTGGNITVNLPAANAVTPTGSNVIMVTNNSDSVNSVTVVPAGADTIGGAANMVLAARSSVMLVSDGVSEWLAF